MSVKLRRHKKKRIALIGCVMLAAVAAIISVYVFYDNLQQEVAVSCNDDYNPTPPVTVENKGESTLFESNDMLIENEVVTKDLLNEKSDWFDKEDRLVEHSFMEGVIPVTLDGPIAGRYVDIILFNHGREDEIVAAKVIVVSSQGNKLLLRLKPTEREYLKQAAAEGSLYLAVYQDENQPAANVTYAPPYLITGEETEIE